MPRLRAIASAIAGAEREIRRGSGVDDVPAMRARIFLVDESEGATADPDDAATAAVDGLVEVTVEHFDRVKIPSDVRAETRLFDEDVALRKKFGARLKACRREHEGSPTRVVELHIALGTRGTVSVRAGKDPDGLKRQPVVVCFVSALRRLRLPERKKLRHLFVQVHLGPRVTPEP